MEKEMSEWTCRTEHHLAYSGVLPKAMNDPFHYEPHPLCLAARADAMPAISRLMAGETEGKMFGVLAVEDGRHSISYLVAYSGQIRGRSDWPGFVPAVFDYLQPDGYFKQHEAIISAYNGRLATLQQLPARQETIRKLTAIRKFALAERERLNTELRLAREKRSEIRASKMLSKEEEAVLVRESQFMKAESRRKKRVTSVRLAELESLLNAYDEPINVLKVERRAKSEMLQRWLAANFQMLNMRGETRSLPAIFRDTSLGRTPAGAGECCAPKLLQYAYSHGLRPLQMAEFWVGPSPKVEVRHDGRFYPACRGKCLPILRWMLATENSDAYSQDLGLLPAAPHSASVLTQVELPVIYEDESIVVVNKPAGLLSVPGISDYYSVWSIMRSRYPDTDSPLVAHRLDQPTSGIMLIGKTRQALINLQQQFAFHEVRKKYVALLEQGWADIKETRGTISLPLYSDPLNRPYQSVDAARGKNAVTEYEYLCDTNGHARVALYPKTGRTHQLRVHCAHADGLANPILGDSLYGKMQAGRLFLHAESITFRHPATGEAVYFTAPPPF